MRVIAPLYMTNNIKTMLFIAVDLLLFLSITTYMVYTFLDTPQNFSEMTERETVYMENSKIMPEEDVWSGSAVIGKLYRISDDQVPIKVENQLYETEEDVKLHQNKVLTNKKYKMSLQYSEQGKISEIVFKKIS